MSKMIRLNTNHFPVIIEAMKFATPDITLPGMEADPNLVPAEKKKESIINKLTNNDGTSFLTGEEIAFAYDAVCNYRKWLKMEMPKHPKGTKMHKKTKKHLEIIPKLMATVFANVVVSY
ncbi:MAG: hypothetical protein IKV96_01030 [Firmicutes bacterium]|nr:hypothetical protein [Bacillota bacterium]